MGISSYSIRNPQNFLVSLKCKKSKKSGKYTPSIENIFNDYQDFNTYEVQDVSVETRSNQIYLEVLMGEIQKLKAQIEVLQEENENLSE